MGDRVVDKVSVHAYLAPCLVELAPHGLRGENHSYP